MKNFSSKSSSQTTSDLVESVALAENERRTRCEVWTRVMGYHRPVANFNVGKKAEHYSRRHFLEAKTINSKFTAKLS